MAAELVSWMALGRAALIVAAFLAFCWSLRRMRQESAEQLERLLTEQRQARAETQALADKVSAIITLVAAIPSRLERAAETPAPTPAPRREPPQVRSYETVRRLARSGATVEEIVATCGVAGTEARLLRRLHGVGSGRDNAA